MTEIVKESMLEDNNIYQQEYSTDLNFVTDKQLIAIIMGYREYPIMIDGVTISSDNNDYDAMVSLIRTGNYLKSYECDSNNNITKIIFAYMGVT